MLPNTVFLCLSEGFFSVSLNLLFQFSLAAVVRVVVITADFAFYLQETKFFTSIASLAVNEY